VKNNFGDISGLLKSRWRVLIHDTIMIPVAWFGAYWLRFNLDTIPDNFFREAIELVPLVIGIHFLTFLMFGVHRGLWRFISIPDLTRLIKSVVIGTAVVAITIFFVTRLEAVPRSVFLLHGLLLLTMVTGPRLIYRLMKDRHINTNAQQKVLVVGAGVTGELMVRDLHRTRPRVYEPVAFVDDDATRKGKDIQGVRVLGNSTTIPLLVERMGIRLIIIAVPTATAQQMQYIVSWCEKSGVPFRTLPNLRDMVSKNVSTSDLRKVEIDDLLGREQVTLDWQHISAGLTGKRILVTGGGGSIGSELCRQLAGLNPAHLIILDQSEFNLYTIAHELNRSFPDLVLSPILADVVDRDGLNNHFQNFEPEVIFHAAAYKHVPLLQAQIRETVRNNIVGTRNVADAAREAKCETFVLISTDKAVNPTSMMGASKRVAEIYCQSLNRQCDVRFITVRFGNVLGSAGSVVPLFKKQIEEGGPVTVTHPDVVRYFMSIKEASQLILQASLLGEGGEIYVLDMGEPINIAYLARQMIVLSGKEPDVDIQLEFIGLRDGEKMNEELFHSEEVMSDTDHHKILLARSRTFDFATVGRVCDRLKLGSDSFDIASMEQLVVQLVPEFSPSTPENEEIA
jgi:FlaA1/EpsC-like NDP-sugar epimerase